LLWLPDSSPGPAEFLDWRRGQPLESVHRIFRGGDALVLIGFLHGTVEVGVEALRKGGAVSPRVVEVWKGAGNLQVDLRGWIWTLLGPDLAAWDGAGWVRHRLPEALEGHDVGGVLGRDTRGGLWVPYRHRRWVDARQELVLTDKMAVFDPALVRWSLFESPDEALVALRRAAPEAGLDLPGRSQPVFQDALRIAFQGYEWNGRGQVLKYYDGVRWESWSLEEMGFRRPGYLAPPFFDRAGRLTMSFPNPGGVQHNRTRRLEGGAWVDAGYEPAHLADPVGSWDPRRRTRERMQAIESASGVSWISGRGELLQNHRGILIPQFELDHVHPFLGPRRVEEVWVDARGHLVLQTTVRAGNFGGNAWYVVLSAPGSEGVSRPTLVDVRSEAVELRLDAPGAGAGAASEEGGGFSSVRLTPEGLVLSWAAPGVLEMAEQVEGPWWPVLNARSPFTVPVSGPAGFFRIRR